MKQVQKRGKFLDAATIEEHVDLDGLLARPPGAPVSEETGHAGVHIVAKRHGCQKDDSWDLDSMSTLMLNHIWQHNSTGIAAWLLIQHDSTDEGVRSTLQLAVRQLMMRSSFTDLTSSLSRTCAQSGGAAHYNALR